MASPPTPVSSERLSRRLSEVASFYRGPGEVRLGSGEFVRAVRLRLTNIAAQVIQVNSEDPAAAACRQFAAYKFAGLPVGGWVVATCQRGSERLASQLQRKLLIGYPRGRKPGWRLPIEREMRHRSRRDWLVGVVGKALLVEIVANQRQP